MLKPLSLEGALRLRDFFKSAGFTYDAFRRNINLKEIPSQRAGNIGGDCGNSGGRCHNESNVIKHISESSLKTNRDFVVRMGARRSP